MDSKEPYMKQDFLQQMRALLGSEYSEYVQSLEQPLYKGITKNKLKHSNVSLERSFDLRQSPFSQDSYYAKTAVSGCHPLHKAGLFYMQEPSAASAVSILDPQQEDWVLDLCAAPGGKSAQIASALQHTGFLVANEYVSKRAMVLVSNLERMGVQEAMITNASTNLLCRAMMGCFDKVLVDAPCSGEGMMKKHDLASQEWSIANVEACAKRQREILSDAYLALKQDGILVYSTCTYNQIENEAIVFAFLNKHPDMELIDCDVTFGRSGIPYKDLDIMKVRRIFPMDEGEGHFIAKFKKHGEQPKVKLKFQKAKPVDSQIEAFIKLFLPMPSYAYEHNQKLYIKNSPFIELEKIHILRQGILVGEMIKHRLEPHHHFFMTVDGYKHTPCIVPLDEEEVLHYYRGNVLLKSVCKGYVALAYQGVVVGFGKSDGTYIKNKYPKGLRLR